jgi:ribosomal-protein-alanine N-acetyltransferase
MAYELTTSRLRLAPIATRDLDELHRLWTEPEVRKYIWDGVAISRQETASIIARSCEHFQRQQYGLWSMKPAVAHPAKDRIIGFCGFWYFRDPPELELIYGLEPAYWGRGLATEAVCSMIHYGFDRLSFKSIAGSTDAANTRSALVMERAGMTLIKHAAAGGLDTLFYAISRSEFEHSATTNGFEPGKLRVKQE